MEISFSRSEKFAKEFKGLHKKYPSLGKDLELLQKVLRVNPTGTHTDTIVQIAGLGAEILLSFFKVKKFYCESMRSNTLLRVVYVYDQSHDLIQLIEFVEIYKKEDHRENHDVVYIRKNYSGKTHLTPDDAID